MSWQKINEVRIMKYVSHKAAKINECSKENCSINLFYVFHGSLRTIIPRLENFKYLQN